MSNIDISQDSVKSISDKCNQLKDLKITNRRSRRKIIYSKKSIKRFRGENNSRDDAGSWCIFAEVS